jgi:hypothetical protein
MNNQFENWTYEEYHTFVMLYAANSDGEISDKERDLITQESSAVTYAKIKSLFQACDDNQALDVIFSYSEKYCANQADRDRILADMQSIYQADSDFEQIEKGVHQLFKRML